MVTRSRGGIRNFICLETASFQRVEKHLPFLRRMFLVIRYLPCEVAFRATVGEDAGDSIAPEIATASRSDGANVGLRAGPLSDCEYQVLIPWNSS